MSNMTKETAIKLALDGQAVLFLGAGFSRSAVSVAGKAIMTGRELAESLAGQVGLDQDTPLDDAAEIFIEDRSAEELVEFLRSQFQVKDLSK